MDKKRVVLGMSGGVDSSVAAYLLKKHGYEVIGVTMQIWPDMPGEIVEREGGCCSLSAAEDARRVASNLGIRHYVLNFKDIFKGKVIDYFVDEYIRGRTPNPCIACNRYIKFDALMQKAFELDAFYVATGHYAKLEYDESIGRYIVRKAKDKNKDQTYVLYNLTQFQLEHTLFPLGNYEKSEIRDIARSIGLQVAEKPDSQEICFVEDNDYTGFVEKEAGQRLIEGDIVDKDGHILGRHKGIAYYTIGQRKGLGIAVGRPLYVIDIDPEKNLVIVGDKEDLMGDTLIADDLNFIPFDRLDKEIQVNAKIRYKSEESPATISPSEDGNVIVKFFKRQRAITPGQAIVFYDGDIMVGGGTIIKNLPSHV
ncbi:tRNA 2-thiouridine(34) synthase MnmA [Calorimonas adulescens]|uniref:tRNA-specific 2-thiouridylase MnmA n=1 Tax=Calorimonas adulescens TaxID=2606906 RepID=A0A5D8QH28_9THEO|nr:tRNA 2-thiouridine(34) synthase MnmA [Calorimonas adulescens]TZE83494.1 tRNA 2-thiouridine(34) synthase MnmA [Calorimonas adulescens]